MSTTGLLVGAARTIGSGSSTGTIATFGGFFRLGLEPSSVSSRRGNRGSGTLEPVPPKPMGLPRPWLAPVPSAWVTRFHSSRGHGSR